MAKLFTVHSRGLAASFSDLENVAIGQPTAPLGTPGSILERKNGGGFRFYALQRYGFEGRRTESYIAGPVGDPEAERKVLEVSREIEQSREMMATVRLLLREGYGAMPPKPFAAVASLGNEGFFRAGGMLVGAHAFDAIVNRMGIRSEAFGTEDLALARPAQLAFESPKPLLEMLARHGIDLMEVPALDPGGPTGRYRPRGSSRFLLDLLAPARGKEASVVFAPELSAHAVALPYLGYLVGMGQTTAVLSRYGCAAVRVPLPERLALHKLLVSQLRHGRPQKSGKDIRQAATLIAALAEQHPGALQEAYDDLPRSVVGRVKAAMSLLMPLVADHPEAIAEVGSLY